jgi:hypothetical protein
MNTGRRQLITLLLIIAICSCQKSNQLSSDAPLNLIAEARAYFEASAMKTQTLAGGKASRANGRVPDWNTAVIAKLSFGEAVIVPVKHTGNKIVRPSFSNGAAYRLDDVVKLVLYYDEDGHMKADVLTLLPDNSSVESPGQFAGVMLVEDWTGESLYRMIVDKQNNVRIWKPGMATSGIVGSNDSAIGTELLQRETTVLSSITLCRTLEGFNYSADDPEGYYWSVFLGCDNYYSPNFQKFRGGYSGGDAGQIGGGGGSSPISPANRFSVISATDPIRNFQLYSQCFSNLPGSDYSYQVMLCVSQPEPGTRETWGVAGSASSGADPFVSVGHTFLILSQTTPTGTITRNVGFYPSTAVTPYSPVSQGQLSNDGNHDFDIAVNIDVTNSQFFQILQFVGNGNSQGYLYNLSSNNCTTFALNALGSAGVDLPKTQGSWLNGKGLNPGDLGEDLRNMNLPSNMKRTTTSGSHPNAGDCNN